MADHIAEARFVDMQRLEAGFVDMHSRSCNFLRLADLRQFRESSWNGNVLSRAVLMPLVDLSQF